MSPLTLSVIIRQDFEGAFHWGAAGNTLEGLGHDYLKRAWIRPVACLDSDFSNVQKEEVLERLGFSEKAREKIYHHFKGGREAVLGGLGNKTITLQRIGFSKPEKGPIEPKFYLVVRNEEWMNSVSCGYSRSGAPRAIKIYKNSSSCDFNAVEDLSRLSNPYHECICRLKGGETGIKVLEWGGESLYDLDIAALLKRERWSLYMHLAWLLMNLHAAGYVHGDVKRENIVVIRDASGFIIGLRFVDLDTLAKAEGGVVKGGTGAFFSPDRMRQSLISYPYQLWETHPTEADPKDDVWGMMGLICELEWKAVENLPNWKEQALISPEILKCWDQYASSMLNKCVYFKRVLGHFFRFGVEYFKVNPPTEESALFGGLSGGYLLDPLIMAMSRFDRNDRASAEKLFHTYFQGVPEEFDALP